MAESPVTATSDAKSITTTAAKPVSDIQTTPVQEATNNTPTAEKVVTAIGGGSPATPPSQFAGAMGNLQGSPSTQAGMLQSLQRNYGNRYVGEVIQQTQNPEKAGASTEITTPIDIKGQSEFPGDSLSSLIESKGKPQKNATVPIKFGDIAAGKIKISWRKNNNVVKYEADEQLLEDKFDYPLLNPLATLEITPRLAVKIDDNKIQGSIKLPKKRSLTNRLQKEAELLGLSGFEWSKEPEFINKIEAGKLWFGVKNTKIALGSVFSGNVTLLAEDKNITFDSSVTISAKGLVNGTLNLKRSEEGIITGSTELDVNLLKFSGKAKVQWDGVAITGQGNIRYQSEKLSGNVSLRLMEQEQAKEMIQQRKAPPEEKADATPKAAPAKKPPRSGRPIYVIAGDGTLTFAFTEWLTGNAQVIVDPEGHVTVIGEITPQAEVKLFDQKPFKKDFPELKARAIYGLPVIADVFIEAGVGLTLWADVGPGKIYNIKVKGTYSTDPNIRNEFSIEGTINISAAAGITLHGFVDVGVEVLDHEVKVGAGIDGTLGIKGYAEATPIIGYREEGAEDQDKKGVFFMSGEVEIAAQPFLGLSGHLFVKLDSPWWSPAPDKTWKWPLGDKEWALGGGFGILMDVDYVFGSGQAPTVSFKEADFSADKFLTDIIDDRTQPKTGGEEVKQAPWKEKNTPKAEPPKEQPAAKGGVQPGSGKKAPVKPPPIPTGKKKKASKPPTGLEPTGKTPEETENRLVKQEEQKQVATKQAQQKGAKTGAGKAAQEETDKQQQAQQVDPVQKWQRGVAVVEQALEYADKNGIELNELNTILKSIRRHKQYGFTSLYAEDGGEEWIVFGSMSAAKKVKGVKKKVKNSKAIKPKGDGKDLERIKSNQLLDLTDYMNPIGNQFPPRTLDPNYISPKDAKGRTNAERAKAGLAPILPNGEIVVLHHKRQNFFSKLDEHSASFHQSVLNDPEFHPFTDDPDYLSWRGEVAEYKGQIKTLGYIYDRIRAKYWRGRF